MSKNIDITPFNDKEQAHGYWETYWSGDLVFKCFYHNGKLVGYEEEYYHYHNGKLTKKRYNL